MLCSAGRLADANREGGVPARHELGAGARGGDDAALGEEVVRKTGALRVSRFATRVKVWSPAALCALVGVAGMVVGGCAETDGWLWDPSKVGRWEHTPTRVPVLTRISSIEGPEDEYVEFSDPTDGDLIPDPSGYRIGPGDVLDLVVWDLVREDEATPLRRIVDLDGNIEVLQLGTIRVGGQTAELAKASIAEKLKELTANPTVDLSVTQRSQMRFHVVGAVQQPGTYFIPTPDFRLLDAIASAQGASEEPDYYYVIRQIPLTEATAGTAPMIPNVQPTREPSNPTDIINKILDEGGKAPGGGGGGGSPAVMAQPGGNQPEAKPPVDIPDASAQPGTPPSASPGGDNTWMFINGKWVSVKRQATPANAASQPTATRTELMTQRVIRIPRAKLFSGLPKYNIIVRSNDVIRVPPQPQSFVYMAGEIARPGSYGLANRLTLMRAIDAAGGLTPIAVPERVDIVRMSGTEHQSTVRVNLRAINEGTQPDIFLKDNDRINVGTNFWATPLAIIRNGFRTTYGFGFLLDRNFADDVFGDGNK